MKWTDVEKKLMMLQNKEFQEMYLSMTEFLEVKKPTPPKVWIVRSFAPTDVVSKPLPPNVEILGAGSRVDVTNNGQVANALKSCDEYGFPGAVWLEPPCLSQNLKKYNRLVNNMIFMMEELLRKSPSTKLYWSWPQGARDWYTQVGRRVDTALKKLEYDHVDINLCRYSEKGRNGAFVNDILTIATSDRSFKKHYGHKTCLGGHSHEEHDMMLSLGTLPNFARSVMQYFEGWKDVDDQIPEILSHLFTTATEETATASSSPLPENKEDVERFDAQLKKLHNATGHATFRNLARVLRDAKKPEWMISRCLNSKCATCESLKPGGRDIPVASVSAPPAIWSHVVADVGELTSATRRRRSSS